MRRHVLVAYDIGDPECLRRVARVCEDFGDRVQLSVFACQLAARDLAVLRERLRDLVHGPNDQVLFFDLGPVPEEGASGSLRVEAMGRPASLLDRRRLVY